MKLFHSFFVFFLLTSICLGQSCMHVSCREAYREDKCGCYFPGQCGDSFGYARAYKTCDSGGKLTCKTVPRQVGMRGECVSEVNWLKVLNCAGSWIQSAPPCAAVLRTIAKGGKPSNSEWAICAAGISQAVGNCQLCGEIVTCSNGVSMPLVVNEFYYAELGGDCSGGRYPCDPF